MNNMTKAEFFRVLLSDNNKLIVLSRHLGIRLWPGQLVLDKNQNKKMRAKSVSGKIILVLCIASFLAGSLFTRRNWTHTSENKGGISHHVEEKLSLVGAECDHKRVSFSMAYFFFSFLE